MLQVLVSHAQAGDYVQAARIQFRLMDVARAVTSGYGVPGLKAAMDWLGYYGGPPRPPLLPIDEASRTETGQMLRLAELLNDGDCP